MTAFALGRPELAALGAPFAAYLLLGLVLARTPQLQVAFTLERERILEGETVSAAIEITADRTLELELLLALPPALTVAGGGERVVVRVVPEMPKVLELELTAARWGAFGVGDLAVRARESSGLVSYDERVARSATLRAYPRAERLQSLVRPFDTQPRSGNRVSRVKGDGIEFADTRPFVPGDRVHRINWRASARRQALYVNEAHPELNSDVVLFLDSFAEARRELVGTLDLAVRAAASLAGEYLDQRDRVGIVGFGAVVRWLSPSLGRRQLYRIVDSLLETEVALSYAWPGIDVLPPRSLPPQALVIALTPLLDDRSVTALLDLRARGFDLVVVDVSPLPFASGAGDELDALALRLWSLWRDALRYRYERLGVAVVEWSDQNGLAETIEAARAFRRHARRARA